MEGGGSNKKKTSRLRFNVKSEEAIWKNDKVKIKKSMWRRRNEC